MRSKRKHDRGHALAVRCDGDAIIHRRLAQHVFLQERRRCNGEFVDFDEIAEVGRDQRACLFDPTCAYAVDNHCRPKQVTARRLGVLCLWKTHMGQHFLRVADSIETNFHVLHFDALALRQEVFVLSFSCHLQHILGNPLHDLG